MFKENTFRSDTEKGTIFSSKNWEKIAWKVNFLSKSLLNLRALKLKELYITCKNLILFKIEENLKLLIKKIVKTFN